MGGFPRREGQRLVVSPEQAAFVRKLRVEEGQSYRGIARTCYEAWYMETGKVAPEWWLEPHNQYTGELLCLAAAEHFGEDITSDAWQYGPDHASRAPVTSG
jgi:hypothetical protein